jgi:type II secretory pathway pseudopilin PulG
VRRPHPRRRRRTKVALLVAVAILATLGASLAVTLLSVRRDLERGRAAMEQGRSQLLAGDVQTAAASFREGRASFANAEVAANGPIVGATGWIPGIGRTSDAVRAMTASAATAADAAIVLTGAIASVPEGLAGLTPRAGAVPLDTLVPLAEAAGRADALMGEAAARLVHTTDSLVLEPVAGALRDAN